MYHIESSIVVSADIQTCWEFFTKSENLEQVTPKEMGFKTIYKSKGEMYEGQIIEHVVKPILGIPLKWTTEITTMKAPHYFIDHQLSGPYSVWHHQHHFEEVANGTKITDIVTYQMPLGPLGNIAHFLFAKKKIQGIFTHRDKVIPGILGEVK